MDLIKVTHSVCLIHKTGLKKATMFAVLKLMEVHISNVWGKHRQTLHVGHWQTTSFI